MNFIKRAIRGIWVRIKCLYQFVYYHIQFWVRKKRNKENYSKLTGLKGKYKGKRCFLIGTGPSLTTDDILKLRGEYTFGVNSFIDATDELEFYPTFYGFIDSACMDHSRENILKNDKSLIFFPRRDMKKKDYENLVKKENAYEFLMLDPGDWIYFSKKMPKDFSSHIDQSVEWGYTVVYSMLQIIAYMEFSEIYLLGMDCCYPKGVQSFKDYRTADDIKNGGFNKGQIVNNFIKSYESAKPYLEKMNIKVYNATRGGYLEVFPRVDLDNILAESI